MYENSRLEKTREIVLFSLVLPTSVYAEDNLSSTLTVCHVNSFHDANSNSKDICGMYVPSSKSKRRMECIGVVGFG
jgi:hypothetical protein